MKAASHAHITISSIQLRKSAIGEFGVHCSLCLKLLGKRGCKGQGFGH